MGYLSYFIIIITIIIINILISIDKYLLYIFQMGYYISFVVIFGF